MFESSASRVQKILSLLIQIKHNNIFPIFCPNVPSCSSAYIFLEEEENFKFSNFFHKPSDCGRELDPNEVKLHSETKLPPQVSVQFVVEAPLHLPSLQLSKIILQKNTLLSLEAFHTVQEKAKSSKRQILFILLIPQSSPFELLCFRTAGDMYKASLMSIKVVIDLHPSYPVVTDNIQQHA